MDPFLGLRIFAVILAALMYMLYDVFNRRNVPSNFAYATLAIGMALTVLYLNPTTIIESVAIAAVIGSLGYIVYKIGQVGAADVVEFTAIALMLPVPLAPFISGSLQFGIPFVVSVGLATGVVALLMVPLYYLPRARIILKKRLAGFVTPRSIVKGTLVVFAYLIFLLFTQLYIGPNPLGVALIVVIMFGSAITTIFEKPITDTMVAYITPREFEDGDIIALNLMGPKEIANARKKTPGFERLLTLKLIKKMQREHLKTKFPVYRSAMPLALPIFIGVVISLLFGNIILYVI